MGVDDRGQGCLVGLGPDMEQPAQVICRSLSSGRGVGHALGAEIRPVAEDRRKQRRGVPDVVAGAQMGKAMGKAVQMSGLSQEIGDIDLWHSVEDQPFRRLDLRLRHFGAPFEMVRTPLTKRTPTSLPVRAW